MPWLSKWRTFIDYVTDRVKRVGIGRGCIITIGQFSDTFQSCEYSPFKSICWGAEAGGLQAWRTVCGAEWVGLGSLIRSFLKIVKRSLGNIAPCYVFISMCETLGGDGLAGQASLALSMVYGVDHEVTEFRVLPLWL